MQRICELRERGVKPVSINCWLRGLKAYLLWSKEQGHKLFKVQFSKTEQKILLTLTPRNSGKLSFISCSKVII